MKYEEKVIDDVLHYRTGPESPWRKMSDVDLTREILILRQKLLSPWPTPYVPPSPAWIKDQLGPPWKITCSSEGIGISNPSFTGNNKNAT
jgi:hypothetical protein